MAEDEPKCDCAGLLIETNAHEDGCATNQMRWDDPEYVAIWESRSTPEQPTDD